MKEPNDIWAGKRQYAEGDLVWLYNPQRKRGLCSKMQQNWERPYRVVKKVNDVVYSIRKVPSEKLKVIHFNRWLHTKATTTTGN